MKIELAYFFKMLENENYCIVKRGDIEKFKIGSDFDIFCFDLNSFSKIIIQSFQKYLKDGYTLNINDSREDQWHIDLVKDKQIIVRFDLYGGMPDYKNIQVKDALFSSIIENRVVEHIKIDDVDTKIYYPCIVDEIIIKYLEYIEHYKLRPDKVKHLDYVLKQIKTDEDNIKFLDKLHYYTKFTKELEVKEISYFNKFIDYITYYILKVKLVVSYLKMYGLKETIVKVKSKIFK